MKKVTLISGNADKLRQAREVFNGTRITLVAIPHVEKPTT